VTEVSVKHLTVMQDLIMIGLNDPDDAEYKQQCVATLLRQLALE
jgi:hypothetical protein